MLRDLIWLRFLSILGILFASSLLSLSLLSPSSSGGEPSVHHFRGWPAGVSLSLQGAGGKESEGKMELLLSRAQDEMWTGVVL